MKNPIKKPALFDRIRTAVRALRGDLILEFTDYRSPQEFKVSTREIDTLAVRCTYPAGFLDLPKEAREIMVRRDVTHQLTDELLKSGAVEISGPRPDLQRGVYEYSALVCVVFPENKAG